ncbi:MAG: M23 family metallopeptidase [bacterium]
MSPFEDRCARAVLRTFVAALACVCAAALACAVAAPSRAADNVSSAGPLWPLAERGCVTGSFGEYRANHYHAGIDLSTGGAIGLAVRAPAAGRIVRLRASPYGYGRAVYIDLDDAERGVRGQQVVYGHLSDFAPRWRALVVAEQERLGKFTVDFAVPDSPRVAAGEVVAFSGDTGAGPPHLHFEVRDGDATAIDPLVNGWRARDETPPAVRAVRFMPLGLDGRVNGGLDPVTIEVERSKNDGVYRVGASTATPRLGGRVGVEVLAWDATTGCDAHRGLHSAELRVDDAVLFATKLDRFVYDVDVNLVNERYVYSGASGSRGRYLRLYNRVSGDGAIVVTDAATSGSAPAERELSITLTDPAANRSRISLVAKFDPTHLSGAQTDARARGADGAGDAGSRATSPSSARGKRSSAAPAAPEVSWRLTPDGVVLRVESAAAMPTQHEGGEIRVELGFWMDTPAAPPRDVRVYEPIAAIGGVTWYGISRYASVMGTDYVGLGGIAVGNAGGRRLRVRWRGAASDSFSTVSEMGPFDFTADQLHPGFIARTSNAAIGGADGTFLGMTTLATRVPPSDARPAVGLVQHGESARFEPMDPPIAKPLEIVFALPEPLREVADRLAICSVDASGGVSALNTSLETRRTAEVGTRDQLVAKTRTLGTFALIEDQSPPRITSLKPANGKTITSKRPQLTVHVSEIGKGLDDEATRFTLDGERLIPEYDPDAALIKATPKAPLSLGAHTFEVTIRDKAGHETSATSRFTVSAGATKTKKTKRSAK